MPNSYSYSPTYDQPNVRERIMSRWQVEGISVVQVEGDDPEVEDEAVDDDEFDPGAHTVDEVKAYVEANPDYAVDISEAEAAGKNRVTLIEWLDEFGET